ncbi:hypothetical protein ABID58_001834 [Bradyrhizobium sp. S3.2.6]|uniref:hypothetical protein n=1 Tax=Bradyrhizobium sp. S3.2.6 TaxID=3156428 RepID=UPI003399BF41
MDDAVFGGQVMLRPIAEYPDAPNVQHYEMPAAFFEQLSSPAGAVVQSLPKKAYLSMVTSYLRAMAATKCWWYRYIQSEKSNGTGPPSRQLRDKAGGVAPTGLSPDLAALCRSTDAYCHRWCSEYAMRNIAGNIADLLMRLWQGSQPASNTQVAAMADNRDRSSMADFVRILQACDQAQ